jgi:hypothetical protein
METEQLPEDEAGSKRIRASGSIGSMTVGGNIYHRKLQLCNALRSLQGVRDGSGEAEVRSDRLSHPRVLIGQPEAIASEARW